jgi:hypothetical protein
MAWILVVLLASLASSGHPPRVGTTVLSPSSSCRWEPIRPARVVAYRPLAIRGGGGGGLVEAWLHWT